MTARTILVVDDSRVSRMMTRAAIAKARPGWTVAEAASGEEALQALAGQVPDFVIMDMNMPGMDGLEAARRIRQEWPDVRVSMLTANIQDAVRAQAASLGIGFMSKPLDEQALAAFLSGMDP